MEVGLSSDLEAKLARIANQRGCDAEAVARDAIERVVNYDDWFKIRLGRKKAHTIYSVPESVAVRIHTRLRNSR